MIDQSDCILCRKYSFAVLEYIKMGNNHSSTGVSSNSSSTLKKHIETATKTGVLQYDNKKLKEVRRFD